MTDDWPDNSHPMETGPARDWTKPDPDLTPLDGEAYWEAKLAAAEAKVAELSVALRHEREQHEQTESEVRTEQARVAELEKWIEDVKHNDEPEAGAVAADWVWRCEHNVKRANDAEARLQRATEALRHIAEGSSWNTSPPPITNRDFAQKVLASLAGEDDDKPALPQREGDYL